MADTGIEGNLPAWPGASACYSKAYRILAAMGLREGRALSFDRVRLIEALDRGDEEEIKGLLLMGHVYHE